MKSVFGFSRSSQHRLHPGQQLYDFEGLDQIVVSPGPESLDPVGHGALGCEKDHRRPGGLDLLQQAVAVDAREHNIQENEIVGVFRNEICCCQPVISLLAGVTVASEIPVNEVGNGPFVLYNQNPYHPKLPPNFKMQHNCIIVASGFEGGVL